MAVHRKSTLLFGATAAVGSTLLLAWWWLDPFGDVQPPVQIETAAIPEAEQIARVAEMHDAWSVVSTHIEALQRRSNDLSKRLVTLEQMPAPHIRITALDSLGVPEKLLDPGPSAFRIRQQSQRTPSGVSRRALEAYTRETGIDPARIEAVMSE
ncbi:MAG: hypothetical protein DHS20C01_38610 [marine bacterium B5-7]|nr:MAG: hypothetical protein DHS20C01_38610 [marine bacterium B5-7]